MSKNQPPFQAKILYVHARRNTKHIGAGHWFFHTGHYVQCASAWYERDSGWCVCLDLEKYNKPLPDCGEMRFSSVEEVKALVSAYYEIPVVDTKPRDMPPPDL